MNAVETTDLLTLLSALDNRIEVNPATALSWSFALDRIPAAVARDAVKAMVDAGDAYRITPQAISRYARPFMARLAADVRSARLRRLVPDDWPETRPLPDRAAAALAAEWAATNDAAELAAGAPAPRREIRP